MSDTVDYLYGVVPASFDTSRPLVGIDETPVRLLVQRDIAALVSTLDGATYTPETIAQRVTDLSWLKPRAVAHDHIVTWASDRTAVVPMPMWTLFTGDDGVLAMLGEQYETLHTNLQQVHDAREYTVRLFATAEGIAAVLGSLSPALADVERQIATASPGQAYLLQRKLDSTRRTEIRAIANRLVTETYDTLSRYARGAVRSPVPDQEEGKALLNASFLVANDQYDDFRQVLTDLVTQYRPAGVRFDFTGPWPAYHFVAPV